jgi:hypothetical protein
MNLGARVRIMVPVFGLAASCSSRGVASERVGKADTERAGTPVLPPTSSAVPTGIVCETVEVFSVAVSALSERETRVDPGPERIEIAPSSVTTSAALTTVAIGPILGSMDSRVVKTALACTTTGFSITATITRSADFVGGVHKNVLWRPRITVAVVLRKADVTYQATWRMRLTTGAEVDNSQTPPYPRETYPIVVTRSLHYVP